MFLRIHGGELYGPEPLGRGDVWIAGGTILGTSNGAPAEVPTAPFLQWTEIDCADALVLPGLIDPHEHLIGGSGEKGFASQTPEITAQEIALGGITTVVGCLGVDTTTRTMGALLGKVKGLNELGLTAFCYSGGYNVPPATLTGSLRSDLLYLQEVIGAGEIAIADQRSTQPSYEELARVAADAYVGGMLSGKAGVTHFHVGPGSARLAAVRQLLDEDVVPARCLYPTHVERTEELFEEAIALSHRGVTVDVDTVEEDLPKWMSMWFEKGGDPSRLTVSSDAGIPSPGTLLAQIAACATETRIPLAQIVATVTANPAAVLQLKNKGRIAKGCDADLIVLEKDFRLRHLVARGNWLVRDGVWHGGDPALDDSNRRVERYGKKKGR